MAGKTAYVVDENKDNVATIVVNGVRVGDEVPVDFDGKNQKVKVITGNENGDLTLGQKFAVRAITKGDTIWKYGLSIGRAMADIRVGEWVHVHNIEPMRGRGDLHKEETKGGAF